MFQIQGVFFPFNFVILKKIWRIYIPKLETLVEFTTLRKKNNSQFCFCLNNHNICQEKINFRYYIIFSI